MHIKHTFLLIFLIYGHLVMAQGISIDKEVEKIDSLVEYNQYNEAEKKSDSLLKLFDNKYNGKEYLEQKLQLLLLKGIMYELKEDNTKALDVLLSAVDQATSNKFHKIACHANIIIALVYEKQANPELSKQYLDAADKVRKEHNLEELYSTILIRRSLYHRWFTKDLDSAMYYTKKAKVYAERYDNKYDIIEATLMIGVYEFKAKKYQESIKYFQAPLRYYLKTNNYNDALLMYNNIADAHIHINHTKEALLYNDSAYAISGKTSNAHQHEIIKQRYELFEAMNNIDSAFFYIKKTRDLREILVKEDEAVTIKTITEQYQNDKKEAIIKSKNQQMVFIASLLIVIACAAALLIRKNRKINAQNKTISKQVEELVKTLEQKQVLLSELQHRVKNNLQHVISILEIQKESVDFNNIDELIRGNQNRIHSMALLHKKLNVSENVNDVDLNRYVTELSELVKDSYDNNKKKIQLNIKCEIEKISIEKALPVGLVVVELVSNSMKHAFRNRGIGIINIEITKDEKTKKSKLYYSDNGSGFDFNIISGKGLGLEIIKGLIDQLNGTVITKSEKGFELTVLF
jgi:two-component sensor histidine kinase